MNLAYVIHMPFKNSAILVEVVICPENAETFFFEAILSLLSHTVVLTLRNVAYYGGQDSRLLSRLPLLGRAA